MLDGEVISFKLRLTCLRLKRSVVPNKRMWHSALSFLNIICLLVTVSALSSCSTNETVERAQATADAAMAEAHEALLASQRAETSAAAADNAARTTGADAQHANHRSDHLPISAAHNWHGHHHHHFNHSGQVHQIPSSGIGSTNPHRIPDSAEAPNLSITDDLAINDRTTSDQLHSHPIIYTKPSSISVDEDTPVTLILEMKGKGSGRNALPPGEFTTKETEVGVSDSVTAKLIGPPDDVSITQSDPPASRQLFSKANAQWTWYVRAKHPGTVVLTLEIYATVHNGQSSRDIQIETFSDKFSVRMSSISWLNWEIARIKPIWAFLGLAPPVAVGAGLVAWWRKRTQRRKTDAFDG